jgi:hypothetical protein
MPNCLIFVVCCLGGGCEQIACMDTEVVNVKAHNETRRHGSDAVDGRLEDSPELKGGNGGARCDASGGLYGAGQ